MLLVLLSSTTEMETQLSLVSSINTVYYVRSIDSNTIELYDTYENSSAATNVTQGRRDFTGEATAGYHY